MKVKLITDFSRSGLENSINDYIYKEKLDIDYLEFQYQLLLDKKGSLYFSCMIINRRSE
jgi:hypothetical protein